MSNCTGPDCTHASHASPVEPVAEPKLKERNPRNTIVCRAFNHNKSKWYFRTAAGELIKPETAIKRGLVTQADIDRALREEAAMKNALKVKPAPAVQAMLEGNG